MLYIRHAANHSQVQLYRGSCDALDRKVPSVRCCAAVPVCLMWRLCDDRYSGGWVVEAAYQLEKSNSLPLFAGCALGLLVSGRVHFSCFSSFFQKLILYFALTVYAAATLHPRLRRQRGSPPAKAQRASARSCTHPCFIWTRITEFH